MDQVSRVWVGLVGSLVFHRDPRVEMFWNINLGLLWACPFGQADTRAKHDPVTGLVAV